MYTQTKVKVLLATAIVKVKGLLEDIHFLRALVDPGSKGTFITEDAVQLLRLPKNEYQYP